MNGKSIDFNYIKYNDFSSMFSMSQKTSYIYGGIDVEVEYVVFTFNGSLNDVQFFLWLQQYKFVLKSFIKRSFYKVFPFPRTKSIISFQRICDNGDTQIIGFAVYDTSNKYYSCSVNVDLE